MESVAVVYIINVIRKNLERIYFLLRFQMQLKSLKGVQGTNPLRVLKKVKQFWLRWDVGRM